MDRFFLRSSSLWRSLLSLAALPLLASHALLLTPTASAQVPQLISYQGRVAVGGVNFNGSGQFRFALVNAAGTTTYWSNDGSSVNGSQPTAAVSLSVANGLYSVLLGDATIANMTAVPGVIFTNADVRLRVWFSDGTNGIQLLTPDQRIAAVGYALMADGVKAGGVTSGMIANGAVGSTQIANGAVGTNQLATGAVGTAQLAPGAVTGALAGAGQAGVGSGGLIFSATENPALVAQGYVRIGTTTTGDTWTARTNGSLPAARSLHTAVWTGTEMIVWGGVGADGVVRNDGGRYNPAANVWTPLPAVGAPPARQYHTAVWTGSDMIVWGGDGQGSSFLADGARFNPATGTWTILPALPPTWQVAGRRFHTAVWTGGEMIVFGGVDFSSNALSDGARFTPALNTWQMLPFAPAARAYHTAVWASSEMIVWGGSGGASPVATGARYTPGGSWAVLGTSGAPAARSSHTAVWTGSEMIVWGGTNASGSSAVATGGRYQRASDAWLPFSPSGLLARQLHTAVWTGTEIVVWGGYLGSTYYNAGARATPDAASWTPLPATPGPLAGRKSHTAVWTGSEMIVWGGDGSTSSGFQDGARYSPAANLWNAAGSGAAPSPRNSHAMVWTGTEILVWGGTDNVALLSDGARYRPALNAWTPMASFPGFVARGGFSTVWTGHEMIVWGGETASGSLNDGGIYAPDSDSWTAVSDPNNQYPEARANHSAIWTGDEMVIFGGNIPSMSFATGWRYKIGRGWLTIATLSNGSRTLHVAAWTGTEMLVHGGAVSFSPNRDDLGRWNRATNQWTTVPYDNAATTPKGRYQAAAAWTGQDLILTGGFGATNEHNSWAFNAAQGIWRQISDAPLVPRGVAISVWTGSRYIEWGGQSDPAGGTFFGDGASFDPQNNRWEALASQDAPSGRTGHRAVWTGSEMMIFGGGVLSGGQFVQSENAIRAYAPRQTVIIYQRP